MNENKKLPTYCCIALLESCFMRCKMCFKWHNSVEYRDPREPSITQWKAFITDLGQMCLAKKPRINFAGGEPLLRKETIELISWAREQGFETLLATNAYLLDDLMAEDLAKAGLNQITISLDSANPKTHDFLRGKPGSFDKVAAAIASLAKYAPRIIIDITTTISGYNIKDAVEVALWANKDKRIHGIGYQAITQPFNTEFDDKWYEKPEYAFLWPNDQDCVRQTMCQLAKLKNSSDLRADFVLENPEDQFAVFSKYFSQPNDFIKQNHCHLDLRALNITPTGDVHICFDKQAIGNIKSNRISELWFSQSAEQARAEIKLCRKNCQSLVNCNFNESEEYVK
ncbi:MAG: radical SAM protein [Candidatus Omnitrophota bacterium]